VYFIFLADGGAPKIAGPGVAYPPTLCTLSTGLLDNAVDRLSIQLSSQGFGRNFEYKVPACSPSPMHVRLIRPIVSYDSYSIADCGVQCSVYAMVKL